MKKPITLLIFFIILLYSCSDSARNDDRQVISVSILPQKYLVEQIAGNKFRINVMVPGGSSPETYEPTPRQIQDAANSVLYLRIGYIEFEGTLLKNMQSQNTRLKFVNTSDGIDLIASEIVNHGDHVHLYGVDPHTWLSVSGVRVQASNILNAIVEADPGNKELYYTNYNNLLLELESIEQFLNDKLSGTKRSSFLVFHPALGYLARDYDLTQLSIEQDGKSPTVANLREVIDVARQEGLKDVLIQMEFERDNALTVARELGGEVILIDPLDENWPGSMKLIGETLNLILNKE